MKNQNLNLKSVLFFGRAKCNLSESILERLKKFGFDVTYVQSNKRGQKLSEDILHWEGDFILCFRSFFILPKKLIQKAKVAAVNFHPGPPEYPGSGCINFALYDNAKVFGVTAHTMNEKIDNGVILEVRRFPIYSHYDLPILLSRTHNELFNLCCDFIEEIKTYGDSIIKNKITLSKDEKWKGKARLLKELDELQTVSSNITEKELYRIIRATYIKEYPPRIKLHGLNFYLNLDDL